MDITNLSGKNLGHKAFENDYTVSLDESLEWWNTLEDE